MPEPGSPRCPDCGATRPGGELPGGLCPRCLCRLALAPAGAAGGDDWNEAGDWLQALGADPDTKRRFVREARAASLLDHPNLCALHDVGEDPELGLFLVMPFYGGETLAERLARGPLELGEAAALATQLAAGLAAAHAAGVVHRDLKPGNLLTTEDGTLKILDFGLAKLRADPATTRAGESAGALAGTWAYMAPEQARGETVDRRADLWAAGVVLYETLTGRHPFPARPPRGFAGPGRPDPPRIHPAVDDLLLRCLDPRPERRPDSAAAIAAAFAALAPPAPAASDARRSLPAAAPPLRPGSRPRLLAPAAWLAFALAVLAGLAMGGHPRSRAAHAPEAGRPAPERSASVLRTVDVGLAGFPDSASAAGASGGRRLYGYDDRLFLAVFPVLLVGAAALAWQNLRRGRADRTRAARLAASVSTLLALAWLAGGRHSGIAAEQFRLAVVALALSLFYGALAWVLYLGVEPLAWRRWPGALRGWDLFLGGRWLDPEVGRAGTAGIACGGGWVLLRRAIASPSVHPPPAGRALAAEVLDGVAASLVTTLVVLALLVVAELALRNRHLASAAAVAVLAAALALPEGRAWPALGVSLAIAATAVFLVRRFGLLGFGVAYLSARVLWLAPADGAGYLAAGLAGLAVAGFWVGVWARSARTGRGRTVQGAQEVP